MHVIPLDVSLKSLAVMTVYIEIKKFFSFAGQRLSQISTGVVNDQRQGRVRFFMQIQFPSNIRTDVRTFLLTLCKQTHLLNQVKLVF